MKCVKKEKNAVKIGKPRLRLLQTINCSFNKKIKGAEFSLRAFYFSACNFSFEKRNN
jgi:hypothetical protein